MGASPKTRECSTASCRQWARVVADGFGGCPGNESASDGGDSVDLRDHRAHGEVAAAQAAKLDHRAGELGLGESLTQRWSPVGAGAGGGADTVTGGGLGAGGCSGGGGGEQPGTSRAKAPMRRESITAAGQHARREANREWQADGRRGSRSGDGTGHGRGTGRGRGTGYGTVLSIHFTRPKREALWKLPLPRMGDQERPPLFCMA